MRISDWSSDVCSSDLASHNRYTASGASGSPGSLVNLSHFNMHLYCIYQFAGIHAARIHDWRRLVSMSGDILDKLDDAGLKNVVHNFYGGSEEHTSELQSLMRISYAVFCLKKKTQNRNKNNKY